jgi:hypothetical protein
MPNFQTGPAFAFDNKSPPTLRELLFKTMHHYAEKTDGSAIRPYPRYRAKSLITNRALMKSLIDKNVHVEIVPHSFAGAGR